VGIRTPACSPCVLRVCGMIVVGGFSVLGVSGVLLEGWAFSLVVGNCHLVVAPERGVRARGGQQHLPLNGD
jgi:hypothetical protein